MNDVNYLESVYAGIIGKTAGVRLGAPVEPTIWSYERVLACYGEVVDYLREYKNFAADDDLNGPLFFIRALSDYYPDSNAQLTSAMVGKAWLDYTREEKGMFWWGGYGRSAEHTAYVHLKNGITPPLSGSIELSGPVMPQQIGGQIFIDTWGLISPNNPLQAADFAGVAARVSHDGAGVEGARFVAAAIAIAFNERSPRRIIEKSLDVLPGNSELAAMIREIISFFENQPDDFRACRAFVEKNFGYWKYPGVCPLPTNAAVIVLSLLYGDGDFGRTIEIATMCGWDTDCNAGNAGTIAGVAYGLPSIPERYRAPINDVIVASSVSGSLNIIDVPGISAFIAAHRYYAAGQKTPDAVARHLPGRQLKFTFDFDGSTHGFRLSDALHFQIKHTDKVSKGTNGGGLEVLVDRLERGQIGRIYHKPYYRRIDFDDERYDPAFTPLVYPGQTIRFSVAVSVMSGRSIRIAPYASGGGKIQEGTYIEYTKTDTDKWAEQVFTIPEIDEVIDEVGVLVMNYSKEKFLGHVYIDDFFVEGNGQLKVDFSRQSIEFGTITQCTTSGGAWSLEDGYVRGTSPGPASLFTGNYYCANYVVSGSVHPIFGESHLLAFRALGIMRAYYFGLNGSDNVALLRNNHGIEVVEETRFDWRVGEEYQLHVEVVENTFMCFIDDRKIFAHECDGAFFSHGMVGYHHCSAGNTMFGAIVQTERA